MKFKTCLTWALVQNLMLGLFLIAALVVLDATAKTERGDMPAGVHECFDPSTGGIATLDTPCPTDN